jgi:glycosyltransferase involved in cell wall biosynthesis
LNILWFNWRDIKHPDAGGAEVYTHQILTRLVEKGHNLTLFTQTSYGNPETETLDGINIVRRGGKYSVYKKAMEYAKIVKGHYDLFIDEINAKPFFRSETVGNTPVLTLIHQLMKEVWLYETPFPLNYLFFYVLEKKWLLSHKSTPTITVSNSSMRDLESLGYKQVYLVPNGLAVKPLDRLRVKESVPTVAFIGRLKRYKLPSHALSAFRIIKKTIPDCRMWIIGDGEMRTSLEKEKPRDTIFFGRVPEREKYDLLSRAHIVLMPSVREGWGLVVTEANAMGTPVIGYNVPGLMDSIVDGKTGLLSQFKSPSRMALQAVELLRNRELLDNYSYNALNYSKQFSWDKSAEKFNQIVINVALSKKVSAVAQV